MPIKKSPKIAKTAKSTKNDKKIVKRAEKEKKSGLEKVLILQKNIKLANEDKILEKVEKYVDKNREKTSQKIMERKSKRPAQQFQEGDLEMMISRINAESMPKNKTKETGKWILYLVYTIIILAIITFCVKYFFNSNLPQIS